MEATYKVVLEKTPRMSAMAGTLLQPTMVSFFDGKHTKVVDNGTTIGGHISSFTACLTEQAPLEAVLATTVGAKAVKAFIDNIAVVLELDTLEAPHVQEDRIGATFVNHNAQLNTVGLEVMKRDDNIIYINDTTDWTDDELFFFMARYEHEWGVRFNISRERLDHINALWELDLTMADTGVVIVGVPWISGVLCGVHGLGGCSISEGHPGVKYTASSGRL
jgi:hypothetical protein